MTNNLPAKDVFGTFGFFRLYLASCVVLGHLSKWDGSCAQNAVFVFYLLSSYVVCYTLNHKYLPMEGGILKFYANRILRIYPAYWVMLIPCALTAAYYPEASDLVDGRIKFHPIFESPGSFIEFFSNILMMPTSNFYGNLLMPQYIPATWSVGIEFMFWLLVPALILSRTCFWVMVALTVIYNLVLNIMMYMRPDQWQWGYLSYFSILSASLPSLLGMVLYHYKSKNRIRIPNYIGILFVALFVYIQHWFRLSGNNAGHEQLTICMFVGFGVIFYLGQIDTKKLPRRIRELDVLVGHMSYGMLLSHQLLAIHVINWTNMTNVRWDLALFSYTYPLTLAFSLIIYVVIEIPVDRLRAKLGHK